MVSRMLVVYSRDLCCSCFGTRHFRPRNALFGHDDLYEARCLALVAMFKLVRVAGAQGIKMLGILDCEMVITVT